jgi:hypothetical protein
MKKLALLIALFLLASCAAAPITPEPTAKTAPEPTPTAEPTVQHYYYDENWLSEYEKLYSDALRAYYEFLIGERGATSSSGEYYTLANDDNYPWISYEKLDKVYFSLIDINGDDIPELCLQTGSVNPRFQYSDSELYEVVSGYIYDTVLANGAIFSHRYDRSESYFYTVYGLDFSPISNISFERVHKDDSNSEFVEFVFHDGIDYIYAEVTQSEWEALTSPYFAEVEASGGEDWWHNWITSDKWIIEYEKEQGIS